MAKTAKAQGNLRGSVRRSGDLHLPETYSRRWGLSPGAEFLVEETTEATYWRLLEGLREAPALQTMTF